MQRGAEKQMCLSGETKLVVKELSAMGRGDTRGTAVAKKETVDVDRDLNGQGPGSGGDDGRMLEKW